MEEPIDVSSMSPEEKEAYEQAVTALANANKDALASLDAGLPTTSMDQLGQAASTLYDLTAGSTGDGEKAKTLDSEARMKAVGIVKVGSPEISTGHRFERTALSETGSGLRQSHDGRAGFRPRRAGAVY